MPGGSSAPSPDRGSEREARDERPRRPAARPRAAGPGRYRGAVRRPGDQPGARPGQTADSPRHRAVPRPRLRHRHVADRLRDPDPDRPSHFDVGVGLGRRRGRRLGGGAARAPSADPAAGGAAPLGRRFAATGALTALVFAPLGYAIVHTSWSPLGSTPWYYYGLARQVADVGSIPATSVEFATTTPFLNDYHLFTTGTAMLLVQDPRAPITVVTIVTLISVLLVSLGAVAAASALGAGRRAALVAIPSVLASGIAAIRLAAYRPKGWASASPDDPGAQPRLVPARGPAIARRGGRAGRHAVAGARHRGRRDRCDGRVGGAGLAGAGSAEGAAAPRRDRPHVVRRGRRRRRAGLQGGVGTATAGGLVDRGGPLDPTWEFYRAARGDPPSIPQSNLGLMHDAMRDLYQGSWWWILPLVLLAVLGLWRRRRDRCPVRRHLHPPGPARPGPGGLGLHVPVAGLRAASHRRVPHRARGEPPGAAPHRVRGGLPGRRGLAVGEVVHSCALGAGRPWCLAGAACVVGILSLVGVARYDVRLAPSANDVRLWRSLPVRQGDVVLTKGEHGGVRTDVMDGVWLLDGRRAYTSRRRCTAQRGDPHTKRIRGWPPRAVPGPWHRGRRRRRPPSRPRTRPRPPRHTARSSRG